MVLQLPCLWYLPHHQLEDEQTGSRSLLSQDPPAGLSASSQPRAGDIQPVPGGGGHRETQSQPLEACLSLFAQWHQPRNNSRGPGGSRLCQVTALSQAGVDGVVGGILMETEHKAGWWEKGPAQAWLGFWQAGPQQEMGPLKVRG